MSNGRKGFSYLFLGIFAGLAIMVLAIEGNPPNMALCTACFIRDSSGAMNFHNNAVTQYFRPEIVGMMAGAGALAIARKEYKANVSTGIMTQFVLGNVMMIGALVFLGCTLRMILRMAAGDLSAYIGFLGFILGVAVGTLFVKKGYSRGTNITAPISQGLVLPIILAITFALTLFVPELFAWSESGPGSLFANPWLALAMSLVFGAIAFYTRLCFSGAIRDVFLAKEFTRLWPILGIFLVILVYNMLVGKFQIQAVGPIAHDQNLWNIPAMFVVGFAAVLANGCPVRQIVLAGSGSLDGAITVLGMFSGAAIAHNFSLAASATSADSIGGPSINGQIAIIASMVILLIIGFIGLSKQE